MCSAGRAGAASPQCLSGLAAAVAAVCVVGCMRMSYGCMHNVGMPSREAYAGSCLDAWSPTLTRRCIVSPVGIAIPSDGALECTARVPRALPALNKHA